MCDLVLDGDEEEHYALDELLAHQYDKAHVEEDASQDGHWDQLEERSHEDGATDQQVGDHRRQTLFPYLRKKKNIFIKKGKNKVLIFRFVFVL